MSENSLQTAAEAYRNRKPIGDSPRGVITRASGPVVEAEGL
jgi:hypothetical protein